MNKAKLNTIMLEVLTEIEEDDVKQKVKDEYIRRLLLRMKNLFDKAYSHFHYGLGSDEDKEAWHLVEGLINESADKYMKEYETTKQK